MSYLSETTIRWLIPDILNSLGGIATKQEILAYIEDNCVLDPIEDLGKSNSRNEPKFYQRVGNIVSHAAKTGIPYFEHSEGFALMENDDADDKNRWLFTLPNLAVSENTLVTKPANINAYKKSSFGKTKIAKNYPWEKIEKKKQKIAYAGEKFVYESELAWVRDHFPSELSRVEWTSQVHGDGYGYDVRSIDPANPYKNRLIEVKSTTSTKSSTPFYMSPNEIRVFQRIPDPNDILVLYRLYKPDKNYTFFSKKIIMRNELLLNYDFEPSAFRVVKK